VDQEHDSPEINRSPTREDLVRIARRLNELGARYLVLGGMAIIQHGLRRMTMDMDLLVDDDPENVSIVCKALSLLSDNAAREVAADDVRQYGVVRIHDEITVDLMQKACGISYNDALPLMQFHELDGVKIPFASPLLLWKTKQTYREKDALDRAFLRQLLDLNP
jgi:hypothetical protein